MIEPRRCGLWKKLDKNGKPMMSGSLSEEEAVFVFQNQFKKQEKDPDYIMKIMPREKSSKVVPIEKKEDDLPF